MTRFLERALVGLDEEPVNHETERLFAYHHATKHSYYSVRASAHFLDWHNQPNPFRTYQGARMVPLERNPPSLDAGTFETMAALAKRRGGGKGRKEEPVPLDARWLSRFLWHSMAVSAWKQVPQSNVRYSLRVNPSSGNLHPTETHLALRGFEGLEDGLYHYRADTHALEQRGRGNWVREFARALEFDGASDAPLIVALTSIFWREAWKYRDRAYRYCCHDLGHALMSLLLAAQALGLPGGAVAHFSDLRLARTLGLAQSNEAPLAFLVFRETAGPKPDRSPQASGSSSTPAESASSTEPPELLPTIPDELSDEEVPYYLLLGMHRSTVLPEPAGRLPRWDDQEEAKEVEEAQPRRDAPLGEVARRRRSALDFDPHTPAMDRADFEQLLDFATRDCPADWRGNFSAAAETAPRRSGDFLELYIYAQRIAGLEPRVYHWSPRRRRLELLHHSEPSASVQRVAAYLSLEQALAGHACFVISMIAHLEVAARFFGNRGYRYVHFEAGAIGQRLYLGAEALGWNATGIGAFYDDDVHRYLGLLEQGGVQGVESAYAAEQAALVTLEARPRGSAPVVISESYEEQRAGEASKPATPQDSVQRDGRSLPQQVIYHFAVGRAVLDPRLAAPET